MLSEKNFKTIVTIGIIAILVILTFLIIRPIILPIIFGILLAYIFSPAYRWLRTKTKRENLSAFFICLGVLIMVLGPIIIIFGALFDQAIEIYFNLQSLDLSEIARGIFPDSEFSATFAGSLNGFISERFADAIQGFSNFIVNLPINLLKLFLILFVFFFTLRDGEKAILYLKSLSPFKKETESQFFKHFKDVTFSVLIGQIIIGIAQGIIAGIGYFIFGVPNALFLTLLTMIVGVIPLIGPWLVWVPIDIYLFASGNTGAGLGLLIYGLLVINWLDAIIRPLIVSRRTKMNSAIVIIGMIGGLISFGILGLIIGPLILAYILLIIDMYRKSKVSEDIFFKKER
tara:strand:- start:14 stop:1045 length:1032 start_codon:yes stop_codon:yes gene_type:complete